MMTAGDHADVTVDQLNHLTHAEAFAAFERCCGARVWAERMCEGRPYADRAALHAAAERCAESLGPDDWREAFAHHPQIGDVAALRARFASTAAWAGDEQRGAASASEATLAALARRNRDYEERFGYIFIICATGKSASEMLAALEDRLGNDPGVELGIAAGEQRKITHLRLEKLLSE